MDAPLRKIIQLASNNDLIFALCSDGSVWVVVGTGWKRVDISQIEETP
jgi:hypothetical protein